MIRARVQHTYNHVSGLPEHGIVNTFYFVHDLMSPGDLQGDEALTLAQVVIDFYDVASAGNNSIDSYLAGQAMATQRHTVKVYDMADSEPRAPKITHTTAGGAANNVNGMLPSEVALCLSYRAALVSGTNAARRRGRVYLGPMSALSDEPSNVTGFNRPSLNVRNAVVGSADKLKDDAADEGWVWCVRSGGGGANPEAVPDVYTPIQYAWCDDAWDTQRRRGAGTLVRTALDLGPVTIPFTQT